jgi:hypothetical protein
MITYPNISFEQPGQITTPLLPMRRGVWVIVSKYIVDTEFINLPPDSNSFVELYDVCNMTFEV